MAESSPPAREPSAESPTSIDEYLAGFPAEVRDRLQSVRETIAGAAPQACETISYRIPTFTLHGNLVHFGAFKRHIGLYPGASAIAAFRADLAGYRTARGSIQFPFDQPMPLALIGKIVRFRVEQSAQS